MPAVHGLPITTAPAYPAEYSAAALILFSFLLRAVAAAVKARSSTQKRTATIGVVVRGTTVTTPATWTSVVVMSKQPTMTSLTVFRCGASQNNYLFRHLYFLKVVY